MFYETRTVAGSSKFTINTFGEVFAEDGRRLDESTTPEGNVRVFIYVDRDYKWVYRNVARLMLQSFRPTVENTDMWTVRYKNGSPLSLGLDNLEWDSSWYAPTKIPGITVPKDAYVQIPNFPRYEINLEGNVRIIENKKPCSVYKSFENTGKYREYITLTRGTTNVPARMQLARALALTFLPHPWDCEHLVVNHVDGNPENLDLLNLEWTTTGRNNQHAFEEGLRDNVRTVVIKSVETGQELKFPTLQRAAEHIGVKRNVLHVYISGKVISKFAPCQGWMVKYEDDPEPWDSTRQRVEGKIIALEMATMTCRIIETRKKAVVVTGVAEATISILCREDTPRPWKGWMFQMLGDRDPSTVGWPVYPKEIIDLFEQMTRKCNPVEVTHIPTGTVKLYLGSKYWWRDVSPAIDPAVLSRHLKINNVWRDWKFKFFDLYDRITGQKTYPVVN